MAQVVWGSPEARTFETGIDRGVLYVGENEGVAWDGLTAVNENPSGGEPKPYYVDGFKYLNIASSEEFVATIEAFGSPLGFGACDGTAQIAAGLFITQQPRKEFDLSYRTLVGNNYQGTELGYKIHLVYSALASPTGRQNATISETTEAMRQSWDITVKPPRAKGYRPTAHMVIDSRTTTSAILTDLENLIYGTEFTKARLPTQEEVLALFGINLYAENS